MAKIHHERIADKLAKKQLRLMDSSSNYPESPAAGTGWPSIKGYQHELRDGGIQSGRISDTGSLVVYKHDLVANPEDYGNITSNVITSGSTLSGPGSQYGLDSATTSASYANYVYPGQQGQSLNNYYLNPPNLNQK